MRDGWVETKLVDAVEVLDRFRKPINSTEREGRQGSVPYYGANGQAGWIDGSIFNEELVLLGEDAIDFADPNARKAYLISGPSWVNNHAHVLRAKSEKVYSYFLAESLNKVDYSQYVSFGTRSKLTQGSMNGIKVLLPPLHEQKRIVDLISSVDAYIKALQQKLESATKTRKAVLHELLSAGGLDWVASSLGQVSDVIGGGTPSTSIPEYWDGDIVWLTPTEITSRDGKVVVDSIRKISESGLKSSGAQMLPRGSVLLTSRASVGFAALSGTELCTNQGFQSLVPNSSISAKFLMFWVQLNRSEFESRSAGSTFKEISKSNVKSIKISVPPQLEQERIVEITSSIDEVIEKTRCAIEEAKNLRRGLLSDLLSGEHEIPDSYDAIMDAQA